MIKIDTYSQLLTIIRNGFISNKRIVSVQKRVRLTLFLLKLVEEGFIAAYEIIPKTNYYRLYLRYNCVGQSRIHGSVRLSTKSLRAYIRVNELQKIRTKTKVFLISTKRGILTDNEALYYNLGGELLCVFY